MKSDAILCHFTCQSETVKICTQGSLNLHKTKCNIETLELPRFQFCSHWRHRGCPNEDPGATKDNKVTTDLTDSMCNFNSLIILILEYVK